MKKTVIIPLLILFLLLLGTTLVVFYARGYRIQFANGKPQLSGTGLLSASSLPVGAEVFINDHLTTATDNTVNLLPGEYTIKIYKEGYFPWEKKIKIQKEVVAEAQALLFPTAPKLENITATGIDNPTIDPSFTQIAYTTASQTTPKKNGIYVLDMASRPLLTLRSSTQIVDDSTDSFSKAHISWSPDGKQIIATVSGNLRSTPTTYLLKADSFNDVPQDITETLTTIQLQWSKEKEEKEKARLVGLKPALRQLIAQHFDILAWSPDDTKILYKASVSATLPIAIVPPLIGTNTTPETRTIKKGEVYAYDTKEDKNYRLLENFSVPLSWFPDSKHLLYVQDKKIDIVEYDNTNNTTIYAGPFVDNYVFPWPNGSKIVILTNLNNPSIAPNLYTISLK